VSATPTLIDHRCRGAAIAYHQVEGRQLMSAPRGLAITAVVLFLLLASETATARTPVQDFPKVCPGLEHRVPNAVIADALANPQTVSGWNQLANPSVPGSPFNSRRTWLWIRSANVPYHPLFNSIQFVAGCPTGVTDLAISGQPDLVPISTGQDSLGPTEPRLPDPLSALYCRRDANGDLVIRVKNRGEAFAPAFLTDVYFYVDDPSQPFARRNLTSPGLLPGEASDLGPVAIPLDQPGGCFPDCAFTINVDPGGGVGDEPGNNRAYGICIG
jgi:hypothetical protein